MSKLLNFLRRNKTPLTEEELEKNERRNAAALYARNLWKQHKIFSPSSPLREQWNRIMVWLVMYNCVQIPMSLAFTFEAGAKDSLDILDSALDAAFGIDILLNCRTSFMVDDGHEEKLVTDGKKIFYSYIQGWFAIDALATFPWQAFGSSGFLKLIKVARLARFAKATNDRAASSARILKLGLGWMLVAHWIACIWWAIGMYEWNKQKVSLEPLPYSSWMIRVGPIW